jgi:hypothetical protein
MSTIIITKDYYDVDTYKLLYKTLTDEDKHFMQTTDDNIEVMLFRRWCTIINSLPPNYYNQYLSQPTQEERNAWLKKYLEYPTKDMSKMPEIL